MKYRAFISYRRQDAGGTARWLRRRLLAFRPPRELLDQLTPEQRSDAERRVAYFLDTSYQSANQDFWVANIEPALLESEYLIVISSPSALKPRSDGSDNWVAREIDTFLKLHGETEGYKRIIVALAPGASTEDFPGRLNAISRQWDWADLRSVGRGAWLRPGAAAQLGDAFLKIVARIYEVPQHLLPILRREEARRRDRLRLAIFATTGAVVASLAAAFAWAMVERGRAIDERAAAVATRNEAQIAQSRYVAQQVRKLTEAGDHGTALALALEALPANVAAPDRPYDAMAEGALLEADWGLRERKILGAVHDWPSALAFSPDGTKVLAAFTEQKPRIWDIATGKQVVLEGQTGIVLTAEFSFDGKLVVTASGSTARIWDAATGRQLVELKGHDGEVTSASFSRNGRGVVTASSDKTARVWATATGKELMVLRGHEGAVMSAQFSGDGHRILTTSQDKTARIWDTLEEKDAIVLRGHEDMVWRGEFSPDGDKVVTAGFDGTARLWDTVSGEQVGLLKIANDAVRSAHFSPTGSGTIALTLEEGPPRLWNGENGGEPHVLRGHDGKVVSAVFSPDGQLVLTAGNDGTARLWDTTGRQLAVLGGHRGSIQVAGFSPDGRQVATASLDGTVRLWDALPRGLLRVSLDIGKGGLVPRVVGSQDEVARAWREGNGAVLAPSASGGTLQFAAFAADGRQVAAILDDGTARVWDATNGAELAVMQEGGARPEERPAAVAFSPDGKRLVFAVGSLARVRELPGGGEVAVARGHDDKVTYADFSSDGSRLVTSSNDRTARLWEAATGRELAVLRGHTGAVTSARFSPDGKTVVTTSADKTARLWDAQDGHALATLSGHQQPVLSARFAPDGRKVVTVSQDNTVRVWDVASGKEVTGFAPLGGGTMVRATFSADGRQVLTAEKGYMSPTAVRLWDSATGRELSTLARYELAFDRMNFSSDGSQFVTMGLVEPIGRVWRLRRGQDLIDHACAVMPRPLSYAQRDQYFLEHEPRIARCGKKPLD